MPGPVFLRGETVTLHPIEPEDAAFLAALLDEPEVRRTVASSYPLSEDDETEWIDALDADDNGRVTLLICVDGEPIGDIGVDRVVQRWGSGEIGYVLHPDAWDQGYGTDAAETFVDYLFDELRFEKLVARVFETNPASARLLEKVGFEHEGTSRGHAFVEGERIDLEIYGLLADDRRAQRS